MDEKPQLKKGTYIPEFEEDPEWEIQVFIIFIMYCTIMTYRLSPQKSVFSLSRNDFNLLFYYI